MKNSQNEGFYKSISAIDFRPIFILLFGCITFTTVTISIPWDLLGYMTHALNIINGNGYTYIDGQAVLFRGPVFSLLIAASFKIFGISPESAFHIIRLFCIANPILIYFFGKKLFNKDVGFVAALLILSSYSISFWSYRHLDAVWPFFVILHCYFLFVGFEKKNVIFFLLAGISLGIAYLTKEVALLYFPLSLLMLFWIKEYRTIDNIKYVILTLIALGITLFPWAFYLWQQDALHFLWGTGGPIVLDEIINSSDISNKSKWFSGVQLNQLLLLMREYLSAFIYFYKGPTNTVTENFFIAPLFLIAWLILLISAIRGNKSCKILVINIILFLPIIFFLGKNHWRFGQVIIVFFISFIAISFISFNITYYISNIMKLSNSGLHLFIYYTCALIIIYMQIFPFSAKHDGYIEFFKNTYIYHFLNGKEIDLSIAGKYNDIYFNKIIQKLKSLDSDNYRILADFDNNAHLFFLKLGGKQNVFKMPYLAGTKKGIIFGNQPEEKEKAIILFSSSKPLEPAYTIYMGFESEVLKLIKENNIMYVVVTPDFYFLNHYFSSSGNYDVVFSTGPKDDTYGKYFIYRVSEELTREYFQPTVTSDTIVFTLNELEGKNSEIFKYMRDSYLHSVASLTNDDVSSILHSIVNLPRFHVDKGEKYYEEGDVQQAIISYHEAVRLDPENVRYHRRLGDLYEKSEQFPLALQQYMNAYQLDPDNQDIIYHLGTLYIKNGQIHSAIEQLQEAVKLEPDNSRYNYLLGTVYKEAGFLEEAYGQLAKAVRSDPDKCVYYLSLGDLFRQEGKWAEAIAQYQIAVKLEPENSVNHNLLGNVYQEAGLLEDAQREFKTAIRLHPENAAYRRFLGDLYKQQGQVKMAIKQYRKAISLEPDNAGYYYLLGSAFQAAGFHEKAHEQFEIAVRLEPSNAWYHRFLGQSHELAGRLEMALEQFQLAVRLDPTITSFHYLLGNLYQKIGRSQEALQQYAELLHIEPENLHYQKLVEQFNADQASALQ